MKKIKHFLLTTLVLLCSALTSWATYSGTPSEPLTQITASNYTNYGFTAENWQAFENYYAIASAEDLYGFAALVNGGRRSANAVLTANIEVNENVLKADGTLNGTPTYSWTPIGTSAYSYEGTFDGNSHTVSGLYFNNTTSSYYPNGGWNVGLIGSANGATIKNVGVIDSYINGGMSVGGICGSCNKTTTITNCYNTGTVSGSSYVGGICGINGTQTNCYNTGTITGSNQAVGGICGRDGTQTNCYNTGTVLGSYYVGGICGMGGTQTNCHNTGTVSGSNYVGGICGQSGTISNCYNTGAVSGTEYVGGICGNNGSQTNCYNTGTVSGSSNYVGGICGYAGTQTNCYNTGTVSGSSNYVGGICGTNNGTQTNCYYLEGCGSQNTRGVSVTAEEFASGEITYRLNGRASGNNNVWRQNLGNGDDIDASPVLDKNHKVVYAMLPCIIGFSNTECANPHSSVNEMGFCPVCGRYTTAATLTNGVYQIGNAAQLYWFADLVNNGETTANAVLTADITVNATIFDESGNLNGTPTYSWTPIGTTTYTYAGTFDGNSHTISGLYFDNTTSDNYPNGGIRVGLIGISNGAAIKNVGVIDSYIRGYQCVGSICGYGYNSTTITNCYNTGTVSGSSQSVGGICGSSDNNKNTTITNCYNAGTVSGRSNVGGICGYNGTQTNCYNTGTVSGTEYVGGICGYGGTQTNCYNTGTVSGSSYDVGGICGGYGTQTNCYNTGTVSGNNSSVGGICGAGGAQTNCYYLADCGGKNNLGVSATTEEFESGKVTFLLNGSTSGDNNVWRQNLDNGNATDAYPVIDKNHKVVYATQPCAIGFSNTSGAVNPHPSSMDAIGRCTACGQFIAQGTLVTESNRDSLNLSADFVGYYAISNSGELYWFADLVNNGETNANAVLTADIVVNATVLNTDGTLNGTPTYSWTPIGTKDKPFAGTFDGNGHTISGLYFNNTNYYEYPAGGKYVGLIGIANGATIKNIGVIDSYIRGYNDVGGICGNGSNTTITNCYNTGTVLSSFDCVGGICGNGSTTITNCYNTGTVSGSRYFVGGICGGGGTLTNCYNTGTVSGSSDVGGICGNNGTLTNCFYLAGCAKDGNNVVQYGVGNGTTGQTTADVAGKTTAATAAEFTSGKITYLLNGSTSGDGNTWRQNLDNGDDVDAYPVLDNHAVVYAKQPCTSEFSNTAGDNNPHLPMNAIGYCTACGQYIAQEPTLVTASNYSDLNLSADFVDYYAISNSAELYWLANFVNNGETTAKAVLTENIVVNEKVLNDDGTLNGTPTYSWTPIGTSSQKYAGTFDGNGHTISGLYFNDNTNLNYPTGGNNVGLIGSAYGATIKNVGVIDSYLKGYSYVGGICGYGSSNTNITNCYNTGTVSSYNNNVGHVGGICGFAGTQTNCYNTGAVSGSYYVGGICGFAGTQTNCYNTGTVSGSAYYVGGICGSGGTQTNCYNTGMVSGQTRVGGICGIGGTLTNCYNTGTVSGSYYYVGGICGSGGTLTNCYYLEGCAKDGNNVEQFGVGNSTQGQTTADTEGNTIAATAAEFANGKIGYLLNNGENTAWYQNLYADELPSLDDSRNLASGYIAGNENDLTVIGDMFLATDYTVAEEKTLTIPEGASLTTTGEAVITNSGTLCANGTLAGNNLAGEGTFVTNRLSLCNISNLSESYVYKGSAYTLENGLSGVAVNTTILGKTFTLDATNSPSYTNNRNVGTATITWTNTANENDILSGQFEITPKEVELVWENTSLTYNGSAQKPTVTATGMVNGEELTVSVSGEQTNAGTYTATASISDNNYKLPDEVTKEFAISKAMPTYTAPENLAVKCNETLSDITLPSGFAFENESAELAIGENTLTVKFTPEDTANYKVVEGIEVKAVKAAHTVITDAAVAATCTESGLTEGSHCSVCHTVLVAQEVIPAGHTAGEAVAENLKAATCTEAGSVDSVVYCSICKEELSRKTVEIEATGHKADSVVFENIVAATCTAAGSKDSVVYCSVCKAEVSRTKVTLPATGHTVVVDSAVAATATTDGLTEGSHCSVCGETIVAQEVIPATGEQGGEGNGNEGGNENQGGNNQGGNENNGGNENQGGNNEGGNENQGGENTEPATAIADDAAPAVNIYAYQNIIVVENATDEIFVYNVMGGLVARGTETTITVNHTGVYIVKTGTTAKRVMINQ